MTVVMDVVDCDKKAEAIINNYPFKTTAKDPTRKVESGINKSVRHQGGCSAYSPNHYLWLHPTEQVEEKQHCSHPDCFELPHMLRQG